MLVFDMDYNLVDIAFEQVDEAFGQPVRPPKLKVKILNARINCISVGEWEIPITSHAIVGRQ